MIRPLAALAICGGAPLVGASEEVSPGDLEFFESRIRPILSTECYKCHAQDAKKIKGGLLLDRKAGWSLQPVAEVAVPEVGDETWPSNDYDRFVLGSLEEKGWQPAPRASSEILLRRVTLALTGLAPTEQELVDYLADPSPGAYGRVVDRLLASPHFGERWARHWMDVVRFAETKAFEQDYTMPFVDRRQFLSRGAMGFGGLALSALLGEEARAASPWAPRSPHFGPKAKSVSFLYMDGGVSLVDSFDPKPRLAQENGQKPKFKVDATVFNSNGNILQSPWEFKQYGESGTPVSGLFPHIGSCADELCVIRSMTAFSPNHPNANYSMHGGHILSGRPSMGAWVSYGLGTESQDLPSYVVIHGGQVPAGGMQCFGSGFLPSTHQASTFLSTSPVLQNIAPPGGARGAASRGGRSTARPMNTDTASCRTS